PHVRISSTFSSRASLRYLLVLSSSPPRPRRLPRSTLFPYTTLFRSRALCTTWPSSTRRSTPRRRWPTGSVTSSWPSPPWGRSSRSEEHTSELQSHLNLVCRLLLEKKKHKINIPTIVPKLQ